MALASQTAAASEPILRSQMARSAAKGSAMVPFQLGGPGLQVRHSNYCSLPILGVMQVLAEIHGGAENGSGVLAAAPADFARGACARCWVNQPAQRQGQAVGGVSVIPLPPPFGLHRAAMQQS